jgi:hypothetical protein
MILKCSSCGSLELTDRDTYVICNFCRSRFENISEKNFEKESLKNSFVGVASDIDDLLNKCKADPSRAKMYANLILDLDPTNDQAQKYLR